MTKALKIVRGIAPAPGDPEPTESMSVIVLKHADGQQSAYGLSPEGYNPGMPPLKGGNWSETVAIDGRTIQNVTVENVTDTIKVNITGATKADVYRSIVILNRFIKDAQRNTATFYQIDPVYLEWWADGSPAPQYALIRNIELQPDIDESPATIVGVTLIIEREGAWRAYPPGANPGLWSRYSQEALPGLDYDYTEIAIIPKTMAPNITVAAPFVFGTVNNRNNYSGSDYSQPSVDNWLDIDNIPGDAPALTLISTEASQIETFGATQFLLWRGTKPLTLPTRGGAGAVRGRPVTLNGSDAQYGTGVSRFNDATYGVVAGDTGVAAVARYAASATYAEWGRHTTAPTWNLDLASMRGRFLVYARGRQVGGTVGGVKIQLSVLTGGISALTLDEVNAVSVLTYLNTTYLGVVAFPLNSRVPIGTDGRGTMVSNGQTMIVRLDATGTTGAITYDLVDLVFVGIDEDYVMINNAAPRYNVVDNTGYSGHGDVSNVLLTNNALDDGNVMEIRGGGIKLIPGITNRIHCLAIYPADNTFPAYHHANATHIMRVWIMPRWYGARDV